MFYRYWSGRAASRLTLDLLKEQGFDESHPLPSMHAHNVTVPGAAAGWCDTIESFGSGKLSMAEILKPATRLAENGFPLHPIAAYYWKRESEKLLREGNKHGKDLLIDGKPPKAGQIMKMPFLAQTFKEISNKGKSGFYEGRIAEAIVSVVRENGGLLSLEDLSHHISTIVEPIYVDYKGQRVWEIPPNGQGITALIALNILEQFKLAEMGHNSAQYLHTLIEALRLAFADSLWYCADPGIVNVPISQLLSKGYAKQRCNIIHSKRRNDSIQHGGPFSSSDTVYFSVVDGSGNACSFINSNYMGFGTGLVPAGCGFTLQNRGANFSLNPDHPNALAPGKRPYHTIIPAMVTDAKTGDLLMSYGVMGGFMQPQGHVQVLLNMSEFNMDPQHALDQPRFCIGPGHEGAVGAVAIEDGIPESVIKELESMGHDLQGPVKGSGRSIFGRGQVITIGNWWADDAERNSDVVLWGGSDPRGDGAAIGY
ncbi:glutathione hydrolase-like YwrD proenzyme isoform X2 [Anneissia japonica]|uniref:glutathione hydrolase-like YwrD proenzyme isoform X2 n=1 Tax=Anneissia japonica TaxID=1529436 RepID=UPI001425AF36|nr:glutathione hydrolase-like YwrD proenzyme isoform X2 [Anneissia japonica]